ncbi:hypothetical protein GWI33_020909 [Rhynchophorus ferrugineus]|uniref:Uncharacterized protein n=1 Tax=Rhynchophorus ferrugineus TaxID=354439 RepID=A0A834HQ32_RHYFE|nr:hypothetical protein GWI33_020909 [Rhynchophorus ferrugineus]
MFGSGRAPFTYSRAPLFATGEKKKNGAGNRRGWRTKGENPVEPRRDRDAGTRESYETIFGKAPEHFRNKWPQNECRLAVLVPCLGTVEEYD